MKKVSDQYEEKTNGIKQQIMEANEYAKMVELNQVVFYHERKQLEEWIGMKCSAVLFHSQIDNWELKHPLSTNILNVKFSRMLLICIYYFITIRLFGVYWWISRFHCT